MAEAITMPVDGMILNWLKAIGDEVAQGEIILEVEADKATMEVEAPIAGVLLEQLAAPGDELEEGAIAGHIGIAGEAGPTTGQAPPRKKAASGTAAAAPAATNGASVTPEGRLKASPIARRIAEERGIDLALVRGTGPGGRITKTDVETFTPDEAPAAPVAAPTGAPDVAPAAAPAVGGLPAQQTWGKLPEDANIEISDISRMRQRIVQGTVLSKQWIPHFYVTSEMDVAALLSLRKELNATLETQGVKITVNDMIVKATALTLREFPNLNSHYYGDKIVRHKDINIGIAVALDGGGLINVVSHHADKLALGELAQQNKAVIARARDGKVKPEDLKGATFTTSNLGAYDVEHFIAIISAPEAGILAVGSAQKVPVILENGTVGIGNRMKCTISVDHRVSDGAEGAQFLQYFRGLIENPMRLLV